MWHTTIAPIYKFTYLLPWDFVLDTFIDEFSTFECFQWVTVSCWSVSVVSNQWTGNVTWSSFLKQTKSSMFSSLCSQQPSYSILFPRDSINISTACARCTTLFLNQRLQEAGESPESELGQSMCLVRVHRFFAPSWCIFERYVSHPKSFTLEIRDTWFCQPRFSQLHIGHCRWRCLYLEYSKRKKPRDWSQRGASWWMPPKLTPNLHLLFEHWNPCYQFSMSCFMLLDLMLLSHIDFGQVHFISQWWRCQGCQEYTSVNLAESYMAKGHGDLGGTLAMGERWGSGWITIKKMATSMSDLKSSNVASDFFSILYSQFHLELICWQHHDEFSLNRS